VRRAASLQALSLVVLLGWLFAAGSRNFQIVNFSLFMLLLPLSIALVLVVFAIADTMDTSGRK